MIIDYVFERRQPLKFDLVDDGEVIGTIETNLDQIQGGTTNSLS